MASADHEPNAVQVSKTADGVTTITISRKHRRNAVGQYLVHIAKQSNVLLTRGPLLQQTAQQPANYTKHSSASKMTQHRKSASSTATTGTSALDLTFTSYPPRTILPNRRVTTAPSSTPITASKKGTSDPWAHRDSFQRSP